MSDASLARTMDEPREGLEYLRPVVVGDAEIRLVAWEAGHGFDAETCRQRYWYRCLWAHQSGRVVRGQLSTWFDSTADRDAAAYKAMVVLQAEERGERVRRLRCSCGAGLGERHEGGCPALAVAASSVDPLDPDEGRR